jgi:hypothetical protein
LKVSNPSDGLANNTLSFFYTFRQTKDFFQTEGYCYFPSPLSTFTAQTTTSIINTPFFVNAIQNGVFNQRRSDLYPYVQGAYLFINSLPLISLRERYKTYTNGNATDLDYMASVFKKFGALHKVPYAWVLKMGSIWHRYKRYTETGVDILDTAWTNFNYITNYDPVGGSVARQYSYQVKGVDGQITTQNIVLQSETTTRITIQNGFYPKLVNDFNYFYNGYDLYQNYTNEDAYAEYVADNMPDLSEVSAAALALIKALRKLESCKLVRSMDSVERISEILEEAITESFNYDEHEDFELYIRDEVDREVASERRDWIAAIEREATDAKLAQPSIDMAGMVQSILTGGKL